MNTVTSKDGTIIAYDRFGEGQPLIIVDGALGQRSGDTFPEQLAALTSPQISVIRHDRRGRGDSTDTQPFAVEREIEDIEALIDAVGGSAFVYGISSGAALAFEAASALGDKVKKLVLYEPPYNDDPDARQAWREYRKNLSETLAQGRKGDALGLFMMLLGMPPDQLDGMRQQPFWAGMEAVAPTLAYDAAALGEESAVPLDRARQLTTPTLVLVGGATEWAFFHENTRKLADALPNGQHRTLEGQSHEVSADALAPALLEFVSA